MNPPRLCTIVRPPSTGDAALLVKAGQSSTSASKRWALIAAVLGSTMAFVDESVVNVALPRIEGDLGTSLSAMQWVVNAYTLALSALLLIGGAAGDRFGRRRIFICGLLLFTCASIACGLSGTVGILIGARTIQGIGAALLIPCSLALISAVYTEKERGAAIGIWSGASAVAAGAGPIIGGWIVDHASWRAIFLINPVLAVPALWLALRRLGESRDEDARGSLDWAGALTVFAGLGCLVYGLIDASSDGWDHPRVLATLGAGVVLLAMFVAIEVRTARPMMPLGLFRSRRFAGVNLLTLFLYGALGGTFFFVPFLIIQVYGFSAAAAGAIFVPFSVILGLLSRWSGRLVDRFGARTPLILGPSIAACGLLLLAILSRDGRYVSFIAPMIVLALGMAITITPLTTTVMNAVKQTQTGLASGINNAVASVASLLVIAVMGTVVLRVLDFSLDQRALHAQATPQMRAALAPSREGFVMPAPSPRLDAAEQARVTNLARASFADTIHIALLIMAALAFASSSIAVILIE